MELNIKNITFVIVTFKSEKVIFDCLNSLPKESPKIIIENSNDLRFKEKLESTYENVTCLLSSNLGMGCGNNIGIKMAKKLGASDIVEKPFVSHVPSVFAGPK